MNFLKRTFPILLVIVLFTGAVAILFSACQKEELELKTIETIPENPPHEEAQVLLQKVIDMGFRTDMIVDQGDYYLVENDIIIIKKDLRHGNYDFDPSAEEYVYEHEHGDGVDCMESANSRQARRTSLVEKLKIGRITVRVNASIPNSGTDNWRTEIIQAINDWNSTQSAIRMVYSIANTADITIQSDIGTLPNGTLAAASWPSSGNPGQSIQINLDFLFNQSVSSAAKRKTMVHELGHCIGFGHTNWAAVGESNTGLIHIIGTPTSDANSVMNSGNALASWSGFSTWDLAAVRIIYPHRYAAGFGYSGDGASMDIANIGGLTSRPDAILMAYDDPAGANQFRYKIAYDLNGSGVASNFSSTKYITGLGHAGDGAGIAIGKIGRDSRPDIILMAYDDPAGANQFRYKVGYDLNTAGNANYWSSVKYVSGVGHLGDGADVAIGNIGGASRPDIILMAYDAPNGANQFRYKVGYDISNSGDVAYWSSVKYISGVGSVGDGAGLRIANIGGNSRSDIILMAYDADGANQFRYKVGYDLSTAGNASYWSSVKYISGVGNFGEGAGMALWNIAGSSRPELFLMAYDVPAGANIFKYKVGYDINTAGNAVHW